MNVGKLYNYFASNFEMKQSTKGWWRFVNPFILAHDTSMAVNFNYGRVKCFKTGYDDFCMNFVMKFEDTDYRSACEIVGEYDEVEYKLTEFEKTYNECVLPDHYKPLYNDSIFSKRAIQYLEDRGFNVQELSNLGFGYCDNGDFMGMIIVPFKIKGQLVFYIGRDFLGREIRYRNAESSIIGKSELLYNEDALNLYDHVYLQEGFTDAMTFGKEGIASLGWKLSNVQKSKIIKSPVKRITIVADHGFYNKALLTAYELYQYKEIKVVNLNDQPPKSDVNKLGLNIVLPLVEKTPIFTESLFVNHMLTE